MRTARGARAAATSREPVPTWHRTRWSFFPQLRCGARPGGRFRGAVPSAQHGGCERGSARARGEGGRRARGWGGMDHQHLGRNWSRWFPPSASQDSEMGPCEREGGSERRVCVRARTGRRGRLFPPAKETQPRGNGAERIIKAGKRSWERRGGAWGGGFTRPGSYYTAVGASFPPCLSLRPPDARAQHSDSPALRASLAIELLEPRSQDERAGALRPLPALLSAPGDRCCGCLPNSCAETRHCANPRGWPGIAFDVTPRGEV